MKKKLIILVIATIAIIGFVLIKAINVQQKAKTVWQTSGYILNSEINEYSSDNVEKFYFNANTEYKLRYDDTLAFKNTNEKEVVTDSNVFIHYTDDSISSFSKGVILNLDDLDDDPILYYNFSEDSIIQKARNNYSIYTINGEVKLTDFIYKISSNKYIIVSNEFQIEFSDGTKRKVSDYLEFEYMDNEVIKLYNDSFFYQTVDTNLRLHLRKNVMVDLEAKVVSKDGSKKLTLDNMVINSNDNINSIDLNEYKDLNELAEEERLAKEAEEKLLEEEQKKLEEEEKAKAQVQTQTTTQTINDSTYTQNSSTTIIGGNNANGALSVEETDKSEKSSEESNNSDNNDNNDNNSNNNNSENNDQSYTEEIVEEDLSVNMPKFNVTKFDNDAVSIKTTIEVLDEENILSKEYNINIYKNVTGKSVFSTVESRGTYTFDISVATLEPNTYYTLSIDSGYKVDEIEYSKVFVYKIFKTDSLGLDFSKNYFTDKSMSFNISIDDTSKVQDAVLQITNSNGELVNSQSINKESTEVSFSGLQSNTNYTVNVTNIYYDNQVIENGFAISKDYKTLKAKPVLGQVEYTIDKKESEFVLSINGTQDDDNSIQSYRYEVYNLNSSTPIYVSEFDKNEKLKIKIDDILIYRDVEYYFKVIVTAYDNEKYVEYESANSSVMIMDSAEFPTVEFDKQEVTYEKINGVIKITDNYGTINLNENLNIVYTDSVGETNSFTSFGSLTIPFNVNNLRANETYKISVYGQVDLQDDNPPIDNCYIGSFSVRTELPYNLVAKLTQNEEDTTNTFSVEFQLQNAEGVTRTLEAETLTGMTLSIYSGATATGAPKKTTYLVDTNINEYESTLMEEYYNKSTVITPATFGLKNSDFKDKTYTLVVSGGYDYTKYQNEIPITDNQIIIKTVGSMPDLPTDTNDTMQVNVIRNRDAVEYDDSLNPETIVGYKVLPYFNNQDGYAIAVTYNICDLTGKVLVSQKFDIGDDYVLPTAQFDVKNGTYYTQDDTTLNYMVRGNSYYFTYSLDMDLNGDGEADGQYPYEVNGVIPELKSKNVKILKQEPNIQLYPSNSSQDSVEYKYIINDVDNALIKDLDINNGYRDELMIYMKNGNQTIPQPLLINEYGNENFNIVGFYNVLVGNIKIYVYQSLQKGIQISERTLVNHGFEGMFSVSDIKYNVTNYSNSIDIELVGPSAIIKRVTSVDVNFITNSNNEITTLENLDMANNIITIPYNKIANLCGKDLTIGVDLWFDDGIFGYDIGSQYYTFEQATALNADVDAIYYNVKNNSITTQNDTWGLKYAIFGFNNNTLELKNRITNEASSWELNLTENGYLHNYDVILPKEVVKSEIQCIGNTTLRFDRVLPSISLLHNNNGEIYFNSDLISTTFLPTLSDIEVCGLTNNSNIFIELYKTDSNGSNPELVRVISKKVSDFGKEIKIDELLPKQYYFIRFYYEDEEKIYLYDIDYNLQGMQYYFGTLTSIDIDNVSVGYLAESYSEKYLDIKYSLKTVLGVDKIYYEIQKYTDETDSYETIISKEAIDPSVPPIKSNMTKKLLITPDQGIQFGDRYQLIITPVKITETQEVEVGQKEYQFELDKLNNPYVIVKGIRNIQNSKIRFSITVYDNDCVSVNGEYNITIYDNYGNDITPEEYRKLIFTESSSKKTFYVDVDDARLGYKIEISTLVDINYSGTDFETYTKVYKLKDISSVNVSFGEVTAKANLEQYNQVDLIFTDSYNLTEIDSLKYTVYDTEGNSESGTISFIPTQAESNESIYYVITLPTRIRESGNYYIQISGMKNDEVLDTETIEYIFID